MAIDWMPAQRDAIFARNCGLIVSAAAGSGKTAVLVERIIELLCEGVPAEKMIIVTFTRDAAAQMKHRLSEGLLRRLENDPDNMLLLRQQNMLGAAKISTISSFCFDLIRENIQLTKLSPAFRIIEENEEELLISSALETLVESSYRSRPLEMRKLFDFLCTSDDRPIVEFLRLFYKRMRKIPFPESWIENVSAGFAISEDGHISTEILRKYQLMLEPKLLELVDKVDAVRRYAEIEFAGVNLPFDADYSYFSALYNVVSAGEPLSARNLANGFEFDRLSFPKKLDTAQSAAAEALKSMREDYKGVYNSLKLLFWSEKEILDDLRDHGTIFGIAAALYSELNALITDLKHEKSVLSFSDAEHIALRLLCEPDENGALKKSALAVELSEYYEFITIDEYQDVDDVQNCIFKTLSKDMLNVFAVGDVKQSIYRFRDANPRIFIDALSGSVPYDGNAGGFKHILLNKNFRSSTEVVDFVNFVFSQLMSEKCGEIDYGKDEFLVQGASYDETPRPTELILIDRDDIKDDAVDSDSRFALQAKAVATRIKQLIASGEQVTDGGEKRCCRPSDFCVLMRNKAHFTLVSNELSRLGVRAYSEALPAYLSSYEITLILELLKIINNPLTDIAFAAVAISPIYGFTAEELARIRLCADGKGLYRGFLLYPESDEAIDELSKKSKRLLKEIAEFRCYAACCLPSELIEKIYAKLDFMSLMRVFEGGEKRNANLRLLLKYASDYEGTGDTSLSGFLRYITRITDSKKDLQSAAEAASTDDVVTITTIHKSKGLEYPFVFLCCTSTRFNNSDSTDSFLFDSVDGVGFRLSSASELKRYDTLPRMLISDKKHNDMLSEEMRLLYVALTRARERLFIPIELADAMKTAPKLLPLLNKGVTARATLSASSMQDWLVEALLTCEGASALRDIIGTPPLYTAVAQPSVLVTKYSVEDEPEEPDEIAPEISPDELLAELESRLDFHYDYSASKLPTKLAVTELTHSEAPVNFNPPDFMREDSALSPTQRGNAAHYFMCCCGLHAASESFEKERDRLVRCGFLTEREGAALNRELFAGLFSSELYKEMCRADDEGRLYRERRFLIDLAQLRAACPDADEMFSDGVLLQGVIDCVIEREDSIVILDYKTDRHITAEKLKERYSQQLRMYSLAASIFYGKPVELAALFSFELSELIAIDNTMFI